jgi:excisionase family DNA binding protein
VWVGEARASNWAGFEHRHMSFAGSKRAKRGCAIHLSSEFSTFSRRFSGFHFYSLGALRCQDRKLRDYTATRAHMLIDGRRTVERSSSGEAVLIEEVRGTTIMDQPGNDNESKRRMAAVGNPWLSVRLAAIHAGVSEKTIRRAYLARQVQYTRVGRAVRFHRTWVDEWMLRSRVDAVA